MSKPVVLCTGTTVAEHCQKILRDNGFEMAFMKLPIGEEDMIAALSRPNVVAVMLRGSPPLNARVLAAAKDLKIISKYGAGVDSVDIAEATQRGIAVMVANGANADGVAELALTLMLGLARQLPKFGRDAREGRWKDMNYNVRDFKAHTVGIVGYGQIGRRAARLAAACGAKVVINSRSKVEPPEGMAWEGDFDAFLKRVDIVSLHCPLTEKTRGLLGERELGLMKKGSFVVNTARGTVIDEPALVAALKSGHLGGAGLDTYAVEPPALDNPLFSLPNVILTPHIASSTTDSQDQLGTIASNNIVSWLLRGEVYDAANFLNPEVAKALV